ncbi:hypothetical protein NZI46_003243 [Escherichia coli]|nr:hypothetical protein [Escherichia coli]
MKLPKRLYYPLPEAAEKLGCAIKDLYHYAYIGALNISVYIPKIDAKKFNFSLCHFINGCNEEELIKYPFNDESAVFGSNFTVGLTGDTEFLDSAIIGPVGNSIKCYYVSSLSGFYYTPADVFADVEFSMRQYIKCSHLTNKYGDDNLMYVFCKGGYEFDVNYLCVMASDLDNIKNTGNFPKITEDSPKASSKRNEVIYSLIKLIPEMGDVDLDTESLPKIADLIDSIAASRGIEFPKTHWQTWQKYLGRESQQKRKK